MSAQMAFQQRDNLPINVTRGTGYTTPEVSGDVLFINAALLKKFSELFAVGTGGMLTTSAICRNIPPPTGSQIQFPVQQIGQLKADDVKSVPRLLNDIRTAFGLTISQLAKVLQVERQTVYLWLDPDQQTKIQARNRERMIDIHRMALEWNSRSAVPASKWIDSPVADGASIFSLLSSEALNVDALRVALAEVAQRATDDLDRRKHASFAETLRRRGFKPPSENAVGAILARYSGTVYSNED